MQLSDISVRSEVLVQNRQQNTTENHDLWGIGSDILMVLLVFSCPSMTSTLRLQYEEKIIREALSSGCYGSRVKLHVLPACSIDDLARHLLDNEYHIIHFSGHSERAQPLSKMLQHLILKNNSNNYSEKSFKEASVTQKLEEVSETLASKVEKSIMDLYDASASTSEFSIDQEQLFSLNFPFQFTLGIRDWNFGDLHVIPVQGCFSYRDMVDHCMGALAFECPETRGSQLPVVSSFPSLFKCSNNEKSSCLLAIVVNTCSSLFQAFHLLPFVPNVFAHLGKISDQESLEFSRGFYDGLSRGFSLSRCHQQAICRMDLKRHMPGMPRRSVSIPYESICKHLVNNGLFEKKCSSKSFYRSLSPSSVGHPLYFHPPMFGFHGAATNDRQYQSFTPSKDSYESNYDHYRNLETISEISANYLLGNNSREANRLRHDRESELESLKQTVKYGMEVLDGKNDYIAYLETQLNQNQHANARMSSMNSSTKSVSTSSSILSSWSNGSPVHVASLSPNKGTARITTNKTHSRNKNAVWKTTTTSKKANHSSSDRDVVTPNKASSSSSKSSFSSPLRSNGKDPTLLSSPTRLKSDDTLESLNSSDKMNKTSQIPLLSTRKKSNGGPNGLSTGALSSTTTISASSDNNNPPLMACLRKYSNASVAFGYRNSSPPHIASHNSTGSSHSKSFVTTGVVNEALHSSVDEEIDPNRMSISVIERNSESEEMKLLTGSNDSMIEIASNSNGNGNGNGNDNEDLDLESHVISWQIHDLDIRADFSQSDKNMNDSTNEYHMIESTNSSFGIEMTIEQ